MSSQQTQRSGPLWGGPGSVLRAPQEMPICPQSWGPVLSPECGPQHCSPALNEPRVVTGVFCLRRARLSTCHMLTTLPQHRHSSCFVNLCQVNTCIILKISQLSPSHLFPARPASWNHLRVLEGSGPVEGTRVQRRGSVPSSAGLPPHGLALSWRMTSLARPRGRHCLSPAGAPSPVLADL